MNGFDLVISSQMVLISYTLHGLNIEARLTMQVQRF